MQTGNHVLTSPGPRLPTADLLEKLGVKKLNRYALVLECNACETTWSPKPDAGGILPRGFWRCPNRCNW
jgi:hypothetical protein